MSKPLYEPAIIRYSERQIHNLTAGCSRRGSLKASLEDLQRVFGFSHMASSGDGKVSCEWVFVDRDGKLITLYSYKGSGEAWGEWSIGGTFNSSHPVIFEEWVKRLLAAARRRAAKRAAAALEATLVAACG